LLNDETVTPSEPFEMVTFDPAMKRVACRESCGIAVAVAFHAPFAESQVAISIAGVG
jgi:hypothetical protein